MGNVTPEVQMFLAELRQHPLFPALIKSVPAPRLVGYRPTKSGNLDSLGANHCYQSGQVAQHKLWLSFLTGEKIPDIGDETSKEKL